MYWDYDGLWQKAKLYASRALAADRNDAAFPFWSTLALEFLARATLSLVNPCLLADPQEGDNLLYACGFASGKAPVSIKAKTVFLRCQRIVENFTEQEYRFCMGLVQRRNEELHTAAPAFEDFPTNLWLAKFFRICELLLSSQKKSLRDLFGDAEATAADAMIKADSEQAKKEAFDLIAAAKKAFAAQIPQDSARNSVSLEEWFAKNAPRFSKLGTCPACGEKCLIRGEKVRSFEPQLQGTDIVQETSVLPTNLRCPFCKLELGTHALLHGAELGGQYTVKDYHDPVAFHGIDPAEYFDPRDYYEPEYGND